MEPFRSVRGGGTRPRSTRPRRPCCADLVDQVRSLVGRTALEGPGADPLSRADRRRRWCTAGRTSRRRTRRSPGCCRTSTATTPEAAGEFRRYTEPALRSAKDQAAQEMLDTLPEAGGRIQLTRDQAARWLTALNDVRLALGVRLGVTEEFEDQWARRSRTTRSASAFEIYAWLGAVQDSLVQAMR